MSGEQVVIQAAASPDLQEIVLAGVLELEQVVIAEVDRTGVLGSQLGE